MRQHVQILLAALLVLIAGFLLYALVFAPEPAVGMTVLEVHGQVVRGDAQGRQVAANAGDILQARETVVVEGEGSAVLAIGSDTQLTVGATSSLKVLDVDATGVRVELQQGRVSAKVRPGSPSLDIASRGRSVRATDAEFEAVVDSDGALAVDASRGSVALSGFEGATELQAGQRLRAMPDQPAVVAAIPQELLLQVSWPDERTTRGTQVGLSGVTEPFAEVRIGLASEGGAGPPGAVADTEAARIRAGPDGSFNATVPLMEGPNAVEVRVRDVAGGEQRDGVTLIRDTPPAQPIHSEIKY